MWSVSTGRQTGPGDFRGPPASLDCPQGGPQNSDVVIDFNEKEREDESASEKRNAAAWVGTGWGRVALPQSEV